MCMQIPGRKFPEEVQHGDNPRDSTAVGMNILEMELATEQEYVNVSL